MAKDPYPSESADRYIVRFPDGMRDKLKRLAAENNRSLNAEIIARLEASLSDIPKFETNPAQLAEMAAKTTLDAFVEEMMRLSGNEPISIVVKRLRKDAEPKD